MFMIDSRANFFVFFYLNNKKKGATKRKIVHRELRKEYGEKGYK